MRYTKLSSLYHIFCYVTMAIVLIVCPFFTIAQQNDTESDTQETSKAQNNNQSQNDTESDTQETHKAQNNNQVPLPNQDITSLLDEQHRKFADQTTVIMVVFVPLLMILLFFLIWIFFRYRTLAQRLDDLRYRIENLAKVNSNLRQDLSAVNRRVQPSVDTFDPDALYQALTLDIQKNTQKILNQIKTITANSTFSSATVHTDKIETSETNKTTIEEQEIIEFCDSYNAGIKDRQKWTIFIGKYQQNFKLDVVNAEERFLKPQVDIDPIFKTSSAGCFLALYIEVEMLYAVVPVYDLVVVRSTYFPGAFGEVFNCSHFDDQSNYRIRELIQPAIFEPDDEKETWTLKTRGKLELREI